MPAAARAVALLGVLLSLLAGCTPPRTLVEPAAPPPLPAAAEPTPVVPRPDHVVVVVLENKRSSSVLGSPEAPFLTGLAASGATLTRSYGVTHPSQPNYLALFSGSTHGVTDNSCPHRFATAANLGSQLRGAGLTFVGYADSLPRTGYTGCAQGRYRRKHNPWVDFANLPGSVNRPFTAFPTDFSRLPTVAFVSPDMCHDMHDCSIATGDAWLRQQFAPYAAWARTHNSLLVVTFDENDGGSANQIATVLVGQAARPGRYGEELNHYGLLRTLQDAYGLPPLAASAAAHPLRSVWTTSPPAEPPPSIANASFELGLAGWSTSGRTATTRSARHGGSLVARIGAAGASRGDSVLSQTVRAPAGSSRLSLWWRGRCTDTASRAWLTATLRDRTAGRTATVLPRRCVRDGRWTRVSAPVVPGHRYTLRLVNRDDGIAATPNRSYVDDVVFS